MSGIYDTFSGSITGEVLSFNPEVIPEPCTLFIRMTRGERRIAEELRKHFGGFERVVIDVDGEQHEFDADSLIRLLENYEDAQGMNNHIRLFGTPERAARTFEETCAACKLDNCGRCGLEGLMNHVGSYDALLEWLRSDAE